jgi:hypothetical protein
MEKASPMDAARFGLLVPLLLALDAWSLLAVGLRALV